MRAPTKGGTKVWARSAGLAFCEQQAELVSVVAARISQLKVVGNGTSLALYAILIGRPALVS